MKGILPVVFISTLGYEDVYASRLFQTSRLVKRNSGQRVVT